MNLGFLYCSTYSIIIRNVVPEASMRASARLLAVQDQEAVPTTFSNLEMQSRKVNGDIGPFHSGSQKPPGIKAFSPTCAGWEFNT